MVLLSLLTTAAVLTVPSDAFVTPLPSTRFQATAAASEGLQRLTSSSGNGSDEPVFYDDFADFGGSSDSSSMSFVLRSRAAWIFFT